MSYENPENIIRSWNVQTNFATGPVTADQLVPPQYSRIRTPFLLTWREEACNSTLNWDSKNFSIYLPESLRVVNDIFLRIKLPALASTTYKKYPGLFAIKTIRLLSQGQEVYSCDYMQHMADHLQQYSEEELYDFAKVYLGSEDVLSKDARNATDPHSEQPVHWQRAEGPSRTRRIPVLPGDQSPGDSDHPERGEIHGG